MKIKRVIRVLEYVGPEDWINAVMARNWVSPEGVPLSPDRFVREKVKIETYLDSYEIKGEHS